MKQRRARSDDVLFISALAVVLLGIELLLYTTGAYTGALRVWPLLVLAVGGILLYVALVRGFSDYFFFGGILFLLVGLLFLVGGIVGWSFKEAWPLGMISAGLAGLASGLVRWKRLRASFAAPSIGFACLGFLFSLFSFRVVDIGFGRFVAEWWPSLVIAGGVSLFAAYGFSSRGGGARSRGPRREARGRRPGHRPKSERENDLERRIDSER